MRFSSIHLDMGAADDLEQLAFRVRLPGRVLGGDVGPTAGELGAGIPSMQCVQVARRMDARRGAVRGEAVPGEYQEWTTNQSSVPIKLSRC